MSDDREFLMVPTWILDDPILMRMPFEYFGIWVHISLLCVKMPEFCCPYSVEEIAWSIRNDDVDSVQEAIDFCIKEGLMEKTDDGLKPKLVVPS